MTQRRIQLEAKAKGKNAAAARSNNAPPKTEQAAKADPKAKAGGLGKGLAATVQQAAELPEK